MTDSVLYPESDIHGRKIPEKVRNWVSRRVDHLTATYEIATTASEKGNLIHGEYQPFDYYEKVRSEELEKTAEVIWAIDGSERYTIYLGRTFDGDFIFEDRSGLVIQIQPGLPILNKQAKEFANVAELQTISNAIDRGDGHVFAPVYGGADQGQWIAREYCTPIYTTGPNYVRPTHDFLTKSNISNQFEEFKEDFHSRGYRGSYKRGNVGLTDSGDIVLLDAGCHTNFKK